MTDENERDRALRIIRDIASGIFHDAHIRDEVAHALNQAADLLERETETCKFNCRKESDAFGAGWHANTMSLGAPPKHDTNPRDAYKEWSEHGDK